MRLVGQSEDGLALGFAGQPATEADRKRRGQRQRISPSSLAVARLESDCRGVAIQGERLGQNATSDGDSATENVAAASARAGRIYNRGPLVCNRWPRSSIRGGRRSGCSHRRPDSVYPPRFGQTRPRAQQGNTRLRCGGRCADPVVLRVAAQSCQRPHGRWRICKGCPREFMPGHYRLHGALDPIPPADDDRSTLDVIKSRTTRCSSASPKNFESTAETFLIDREVRAIMRALPTGRIHWSLQEIICMNLVRFDPVAAILLL